MRSRPHPRAISVYRAPSTDALRDVEYRDPAFQSRAASCKAERIPALRAPPVLSCLTTTLPLQFPPHMPSLRATFLVCATLSTQEPSVFPLHTVRPPSPLPLSVHRKRTRCIFRREARGNFGTLTPEAGFWMVGLDTTRPLT